jgi:hypothetical protein
MTIYLYSNSFKNDLYIHLCISLFVECPIIRKREGEGVRCVLCAEGGDERRTVTSVHPSDQDTVDRRE